MLRIEDGVGGKREAAAEVPRVVPQFLTRRVTRALLTLLDATGCDVMGVHSPLSFSNLKESTCCFAVS